MESASGRFRSQRPAMDDFVLPPAIPKRLDSDFALAVKSPSPLVTGYSRQVLLEQQPVARERSVQQSSLVSARGFGNAVPAGNSRYSVALNARKSPARQQTSGVGLMPRSSAAPTLPAQLRLAPQPLQQTTVLAPRQVFDPDSEILGSMDMEQSPNASTGTTYPDSANTLQVAPQQAAVELRPSSPADAAQAADLHESCRSRVTELEHLLAEERAARSSERVSTAIKQEETMQAAMQAAKAEAVSRLELRVAELQHQLEAEKLRNVELDTALMETVSSYEREKSGWVLDKQSVLAEAEMGYAGLARSVTERAQSTIAALRTELKQMNDALEQERGRADAAESSLRALQLRAKDDARKAAGVQELRAALDKEKADGAAMQDMLQRQIQNLIREAANSRARLFEEVEAETALVLEQARAETAAVRSQLETERNLHAAAHERLKKEYEAQCRAFESRLRAKVSRTISLLRQASMQPGAHDLPSLLSPLVGSLPGVLRPHDMGSKDGVEDTSLAPINATAAEMPAQPDFDQQEDAPSLVQESEQAQQPAQAHSPQLLPADVLIQATRPSPQMPAAVDPVPESAPLAVLHRVEDAPLSFDERADSLLAAADDVLAAVLAAMTPEQRELWQSIERRMRQDGASSQ